MSSKIIGAMLETAKDLELSQITIKEIGSLNLEEIKALDSKKIKKIRVREKLSQAVIAKILNVTPSTYQKWERGEVQPKGASLKLLRLAYDHGIQYIIA
jgi:putative transcriptional regulator